MLTLGLGPQGRGSRVRSSSNVSLLRPMTCAGSFCGQPRAVPHLQLLVCNPGEAQAALLTPSTLPLLPSATLARATLRHTAGRTRRATWLTCVLAGAFGGAAAGLVGVGCSALRAASPALCPACAFLLRLSSSPRRHTGALQHSASSTVLLSAAGLGLGAAALSWCLPSTQQGQDLLLVRLGLPLLSPPPPHAAALARACCLSSPLPSTLLPPPCFTRRPVTCTCALKPSCPHHAPAPRRAPRPAHLSRHVHVCPQALLPSPCARASPRSAPRAPLPSRARVPSSPLALTMRPRLNQPSPRQEMDYEMDHNAAPSRAPHGARDACRQLLDVGLWAA